MRILLTLCSLALLLLAFVIPTQGEARSNQSTPSPKAIDSSKVTPQALRFQEEGEQEERPDESFAHASILALGSLEAFENGMVEALADANLSTPTVVIIPHASAEETRGLKEKQAFEAIGIQSVQIIEQLSGDSTLALLEQANVIWFGDGSPGMLMKELSKHTFTSHFGRLLGNGTLIGASGKATGALGIVFVEGHVDGPLMHFLSVKPVRGLGLWQGLLLPDMFEGTRLAQGISAVLDQPRIPGLGLDANAAVRIADDKLHITGSGSSMFIDARKAKKVWIDEDTPHSIRNANMHTFVLGDTFTWLK